MCTKHILMAGLLLASLCMMLHAQTAAPATQPADKAAISKLVEQLGDTSFQARKDAQAKLQAIGEPAQAALKVAAESQDPEVKQRATAILKNFAEGRFKAASDNIKRNVLWTAAVEGGAVSTPVISDGLAVVAGGDAKLYAIDIKTGKKAWIQGDFDKAMMLNQPVVAKGQVIVSAVPPQENGAIPQPGVAVSQMVYAVDLKTGKVNWRFNVPKAETQPANQQPQGNVIRGPMMMGATTTANEQPGVSAKAVFARDPDGKLQTLDLATGNSLSKAEVETIGSRPVASESLLFIPLANGEIQALDLATGKQAWKERFVHQGMQMPCTQLTVVGDLLCFRAWQALIAVEAKTGKKAWQCDLPRNSFMTYRTVTVINGRMITSGTQSEGALATHGSAIYLMDGPDLVAVDTKTGNQQRRYAIKLPGQPEADGSPNIGRGMNIQAGGAQVQMKMIAIGQAQGIARGGEILASSVAVADRTAYLGANNSIIALDLDSGFAIWQLNLGGNPAGSPVVVDGVMYCGWTAGRIQVSGRVDGNPLAMGETGLQAVKVK